MFAGESVEQEPARCRLQRRFLLRGSEAPLVRACVLGVDGQRQHVRQALFVRKVLGLDLEFRRFSVYDLNPQTVGRFDITLALGLVYHLKHLVFALERLYDVTNELLIVETAIIPPEQTPESFVQPLGEIRADSASDFLRRESAGFEGAGL